MRLIYRNIDYLERDLSVQIKSSLNLMIGVKKMQSFDYNHNYLMMPHNDVINKLFRFKQRAVTRH